MVIQTCGPIHRHVGGLVTENLISIFLRQRKDWDEVSCSEIWQTVSLMGHADPVIGKGVRILSVDGGGSRGIVPSEILRKLEDLCQQKKGDLFDFVIGFGSDSVLLSIAKVSLDECEHLYMEMSKTVFERNGFQGTSNLFLNCTFYDFEGWMKISRSHFQGISSMQISETARDPTSPKWVESYALWMAEKVRKTRKGPKCIEDKHLLENKRIQKECKELFWDKCGDSNQHPRQKKLEDKAGRKLSKGKTIKKEECKEGDSTQANPSLEQAEPVRPIDGTKPPDVGKCLKGTTSIKTFWICAFEPVEAFIIFLGILFKNLLWYLHLKDTSRTEKGENQNHPPLETLKTPKTLLKIGKKRQVLKNRPYGSQKHHWTTKRLLLFFTPLMMLSRFGFGLTAGVPVTRFPVTPEPRGTGMLPLACTSNGSKFNDTWLNRSEVEMMIRGGTFNGSNRGYTNICPNAFHGFHLNEIDLSFNNITEISDDLFENVPGLERVNLGCNSLTSFPVALNKCPDLVFFNISFNDIQNISRNSFNKATSLRGFDASGNVNLIQYPDDLFYLPNRLTVYLGNTAISNPPFPLLPYTRAIESFNLKCEKGYILRLERENRDVIFYLQNTDALSSKNWKVKVNGDPEGRLVPYDCETQSFGPFEIVENDRSTTPIPMARLSNYDFSSTVTSVSDATQPQNNCGAPQNAFNAGVVIIVIFQDILLFCIYRLHLKGKNKSPHYEKVVVLAFVVRIVQCIVAFISYGIWVALSVVVETPVAVLAALVYSFVIKKNNSTSTPVQNAVYNPVSQTTSINSPEGDDQC